MMLYAAIDIHKHAFQAAVLDPDSGEVVEERFAADRGSLAHWAGPWRGRVAAVAIEATTGWRWVWRELAGEGFDVRLAEPVQTRALLGRRRSAKTDRLDARWLAQLLAKEMLPESWIPPAEIQELRDRTRLRKRWAAALQLSEHARLQVDSLLAVIAALEAQLDTVEGELRRFARQTNQSDTQKSAHYPGRSSPATCSPRSARRAGSAAPSRSLVSTRSSTSPARAAAAAISPRPARRICAGRLVEAAVHAHRTTAPDLTLYHATRQRRDTTVARLTVARKVGKRAFHTLRELELATA